MINRRSALGLLCSVAAYSSVTNPGLASSAAAYASKKINIAGRQRMLSQRMTMAALMVQLGVETARFRETLVGSISLFEKSLNGLRHGDEDLGLPEEASGNVLQALDAVDTVWGELQPSVASIPADGLMLAQDVDVLARMNAPLLLTSDNVVKQLVSAYGDDSIPLGLAISINVSGRQRMLSQKMAKEVAMIAMEIQPDPTRRALRATADLYASSLDALIGGLPSVTLPPPPEHIRLKLLEVASIWADYRIIVEGVADGGPAGMAELFTIAAQVDPILKTMNDAVTLYEELA